MCPSELLLLGACGWFEGTASVAGEDFFDESFDAFAGEVALRVDVACLEVPGECGAGLGGDAVFELAGHVEGFGEVGDLGGEEFEFAAEFRVVGEVFAEGGELFPGGVVLADFGEFLGFSEGAFDGGEVGDDLFEGVFAGGVSLDGGGDFVLAAVDFAVVAFAEEAVEVVACGDDDARGADEVAEFVEFRVGGPDFGGGFDFFRGLFVGRRR